ncbi:glycosyltransferase [Methylicorpusculum oleiharenae]|uniref:glycosyltransferase family 2 protein n=1 Tax=Methylicorpusculum oleiharenae TaxID=1338687 RepID=UPI0013572BFA|nr:glycosyltransferase family 2 protein [Methylicorpusculum oleiharenae]MCD2452738.1 glycosyltransferase [Methylicorpusculum oleiharenae]
MHNPKPLVSVIIPTFNRPQFLARAVNSALAGMDRKDVEVIVVPNGPDQSWSKALQPFKNNLAVRVIPIPQASGNAARNVGMLNAHGKYIRFLDDDDYLIFAGCVRQYELLESDNFDFCSGLLLNIDMENKDLGQVNFPVSRDFVCASLIISGFTLPIGNVYLRSSLKEARWNENVVRMQDNIWMIDLAGLREWRWVHLDEIVGVWFQHDLARVSSMNFTKDIPFDLVTSIFTLHNLLLEQNRLLDIRKQVIVRTLWFFIHTFFPYAPYYWHQVVKQTRKIDKDYKPENIIFSRPFLRHLDPLTVEWMIFLLRRVKNFYINKKRVALKDYRRIL